jgi:hypothetical protein
VVKKCDTGACLVVTTQPDGSVELHSSRRPDSSVLPVDADEWAAFEAEKQAEGYRRAIADLRATPADPFQLEPWAEKAADYLESQTKPTEAPEPRPDSLRRWLEWLGTPDCPCPSQWKGLGALDGVSMGKGWVRMSTDPHCKHHGAAK